MKLLFVFLFSLLQLFGALPPPNEPYEGLPVRKITIHVENQAPDEIDEEASVLYKMHTKMGDSFDQDIFDRDLKLLSDEYEWVDPAIKVENGQVLISISLKKRPLITNFVISGSSFSDKKILSEGELKKEMRYNREEFYKSIQKIRDFLVKKGYFRAEVSYKVENSPSTNQVTIAIFIQEGPKGRISKIIFENFTKEEESELLEIIRVQTFNALTSWLTGNGVIKEEELDPDIQAIVQHLQNKGYVDAHVSMQLKDLPQNKIALVFTLTRGPQYSIHNVTFSGASLKTDEELKNASLLEPGEVFSLDKIRAAQEHIRELYTQEGYLHTSVDYRLDLLSDKPEYDVHFTVEESQKYRVGLVMVSGNYYTTKNVVYNNIDVEPGEVFDSRKIKSTQDKLQSTGYFKNVNVYPIKSDEHQYGASEYCDVMVEVSEAQTGNASIFAGLNSTDSVFGGVDITENNFSIAGFRNVWTKGPMAFRGGGQFLEVKGSIGKKESSATVSWLDPYFNDTRWRFGTDFEYNWSVLLSTNYHIQTFGTTLTATYPMTPYLSTGFRFRVKDSLIDISSQDAAASSPISASDRSNSGVVSGFATILGYDSTDNPYRPHRGFRSRFETEFAGLVRREIDFNDFPFIRFAYLNSYYYPLFRKGTLKFRGDFKFTQPFWGGTGTDFPLSERFFLGGDSSVRGLAPGKLGAFAPDTTDPLGGMSSSLLSVEYAHNIIKPLDIFVFMDAGAISIHSWAIGETAATAGAGVRLDIGKRLPFVAGYGFPIGMSKEYQENRVQGFFFSMAGQF